MGLPPCKRLPCPRAVVPVLRSMVLASARSEFVHTPSAGPILGESLRFNKTLRVLKLGGNLLGPESGKAFALGVSAGASFVLPLWREARSSAVIGQGRAW